MHGVTEVANGAEEENDDNFVIAFLEKIGANTKPVSITRLGKGDSNKTRPLKIKFANEDVKENVMAKLSNLKQAEF